MSSSYNLENWLALYHCDGIGPITFQKYLAHDPTLHYLPKNLKPDWLAMRRDLEWLATQSNAHIITLADERFPTLLKNIPDPPPLLYVLGKLDCLSQNQIAMVGSRNCSTAGKELAEYFAKKLAGLGLLVTSGLAVGIDAASHRGALACHGGQSIAVLAHGMDMVYPAQHSRLAEQIAANGCLVSEFPIGVQPIPGHFPRRNRIISGLSLGVLVVEATLNSGSLITAHYAVEQNREVFAIPGAINMAKTAGCHQLIKHGAKLVDCVNDVVEELASLLNCAIRDKYACGAETRLAKVGLSAHQQQLLDFIDYDSTSVDLIVGRTGLTSSMIGANLLELELHGLITAVPGGYARKLD